MIPLTNAPAAFEQRYNSLLKHLRLKGMQPKTIDAYARAIRTMGKHFDWQIDSLTAAQLTDYCHGRIDSHSWSAVKLDLYGYKFYVVHVLRQPWTMPGLIRPPKVSRLPDILSVEQVHAAIAATRILSYRVFFFVLYSLGLRISEGLALTAADIDAERGRVHIRDSKGNRDRFVPLAAGHPDRAAPLLARAPQSGADVPQSGWRREGRRSCHHRAGSRRRAARSAPGGAGLRP